MFHNNKLYSVHPHGDIVAEKILPVITDPPVDVETVFLGEANLTCRAVGKPNPTYLWFKVKYIDG